MDFNFNFKLKSIKSDCLNNHLIPPPPPPTLTFLGSLSPLPSTFNFYTEWNILNKRIICDENLTNNIHLLILKLMSWKYIASPESSG